MRSKRAISVAIAVAGLATSAVVMPAFAENRACRESDTFERIMAGARAEWPASQPIELGDEWRQYFMLGYNEDLRFAEPTRADRVVVFPLPPDIAATSYFFGFVDGCLSFYADLSEAKATHLIERGHALAGRHAGPAE